MKTNLWRLGGFAVAIVCATVLSAVVHAHAKLEKTDPADKATLSAPPAHVELWFNEKLDVKTSRITLSSASGPVKLGVVHSLADKTLMADVTGDMPDGNYTAGWQTAGDDGHVLKGEFTFSLKRVKK